MAAESDTKTIFIQVDEGSETPLRTGQSEQEIEQRIFRDRMDELEQQMRAGDPSPFLGADGCCEELKALLTTISYDVKAIVGLMQAGGSPGGITQGADAMQSAQGFIGISGPGMSGGFAGLATALGPQAAAIVAAIGATVTIMDAIHDVAMQIDEHIMSLADDIRRVSGNVRSAEAEANIIELMAMIRRDRAIGADVGTYVTERAELNAAIADLVTELEKDLIPLAVITLRAANFWFTGANFLLKNFKDFGGGDALLGGIHPLLPALMKAAFKFYEDQIKKDNRASFEDAAALLGGEGDAWGDIDMKRFPFAGAFGD